MLSEIKDVRQIKDEGFRRWFTDSYFDLILWYEEQNEISGFQLCYDKNGNERALTWRKDQGFSHEKIDDGDVVPGPKRTPILVPDGKFEKNEIAEKFESESRNIDLKISEFVYGKLMEFPNLL